MSRPRALPRGHRARARRFSVGMLAAAAAAVLATGCSRPKPSAANEAAPAAAPVPVARVAAEKLPVAIPVPATVRPSERAVIAARISGTIESLPVTLGHVVRRGDLLVRLAAPELVARVAQARVQLEQAEREDKRSRGLAAAGADTADAAQRAAENLRSARAALIETEAMSGFSEIRAPYDGRVAQKLAYPGDLATPGQTLLVLERTDSLQIEAAIPESLAAGLHVGGTLPVQLDEAGARLVCPIAEIASAADPTTRTRLVKLALAGVDPLRSGRYATVELPGAAAEMLLLPASAVTRMGQLDRVFVVENGQARLRLVKIGGARDERLEILAGLNAGDVAVLAPPATLRDGQSVQIAQ